MRRPLALLAVIALSGCANATRADDDATPAVAAAASQRDSTSAPSTTAATTTSTTAATTTTTSTTSTTSTTTTTAVAPPITLPPPWSMPALDAVVDRLAAGNLAVSVSVWHDGWPVHQRASGRRIDGERATTATPFVQASVSKLITALTVVRLAERGRLDLDAPPPWTAMGLPHHPAWDTVSVRELMAHESGLPIAQETWFVPGGACTDALVPLLADPPTDRRGQWTYSNGNYCVLGLLVEHLTGERYDVAARRLVLDPANVRSGHLTVDSLRPDDAPYPLGVARLDRLGAAGQWMLSTDDVAAALSLVTRKDLRALDGPGIFRDMVGWGHTGTVDGAKSCAWVIETKRVVVVATVSGNRPDKGSALCAEVVPAVVADIAAT